MVHYWNVFVIKVRGGKKPRWNAYIRGSSAHKVSKSPIIGVGTTADAAIKSFQQQYRRRAASKANSIHNITCEYEGCCV